MGLWTHSNHQTMPYTLAPSTHYIVSGYSEWMEPECRPPFRDQNCVLDGISGNHKATLMIPSFMIYYQVVFQFFSSLSGMII